MWRTAILFLALGALAPRVTAGDPGLEEILRAVRGGGQSFENPLSAEAAGQYEYRLLGRGVFDGYPVWRIGFPPPGRPARGASKVRRSFPSTTRRPCTWSWFPRSSRGS